MNTAIITAPCGDIEGITENGVRRFLGIKYANAKRWEKPEVIQQYDGVYHAGHYGPAPIQHRAYHKASEILEPSFYSKEFWNGIESEYSEDCLYLNIWTPINAEQCPVLIVIYGGGNIAGQADEKPFDGTEFAKRGVIVVTFNYRVNVFGFFTSKELDDMDTTSGNYALYDQLAAFRWIQRNITAFGGDTDKMTLIGQSAGAASVETQIRASVNRGRFHGAIMQSSAGYVSGIPKAMKPKKEAVQMAWHRLFTQSGCASFDEFRNLPAKRLFDLWEENNQGYLMSSNIADDVFREEDVRYACSIPVICGITAQDTATALFYWLTLRFGKRHSDAGKVFAYYFCRKLPGDELGAWHACDLWYTYGALDKSWRPFTDADRELSAHMMEYLTSFIKCGNPNNGMQAEWTPLKRRFRKFMCFDSENQGMRRLNLLRLAWDTITYRGPRS